MRFFIFFILSIVPTFLGTIAEAEIRVVTTIPDFGAIAKEVGGPHVTVQALVKPTQDPHFVDAKPSLMIAINRADLLLVTGMDLESGWLPPLLTGARNSRVQRGGTGYLDCSTLIVPLDMGPVDRARGDVHPGGNPHYWIDPRNGLRLAQGIGKKLMALDPDHARDIRDRLDAFVHRLKGRIADWEKRLAPHRGTKVVVYHESWTYFLDWAGFTAMGALEPKPGIPPKPAHVAELIQQIQTQRVKYLIQESYYPTRLSSVFAEKSGAELKVLPTMVGADGTCSYFDVIERLVSAFTKSGGIK
ncbi:MAG: metal ABC transporter substrate-binding protein [Myxococcota bacterium]|nr:metal ABC transporter substrate-binding protein [Myxococcota bacterium]